MRSTPSTSNTGAPEADAVLERRAASLPFWWSILERSDGGLLERGLDLLPSLYRRPLSSLTRRRSSSLSRFSKDVETIALSRFPHRGDATGHSTRLFQRFAGDSLVEWACLNPHGARDPIALLAVGLEAHCGSLVTRRGMTGRQTQRTKTWLDDRRRLVTIGDVRGDLQAGDRQVALGDARPYGASPHRPRARSSPPTNRALGLPPRRSPSGCGR